MVMVRETTDARLRSEAGVGLGRFDVSVGELFLAGGRVLVGLDRELG
jgi:hypothetical protein